MAVAYCRADSVTGQTVVVDAETDGDALSDRMHPHEADVVP
jgi:hypothetical protein